MTIFKKILQRKEEIFVYAFLLLFFAASCTVSILRYYQFESFYFDFGIFDRALWLAAHFQVPLVYHPNFHGIEKIIFADHFNPSMFLLAPLYWITDKREIFLFIQSFIVAMSASVAYWISRTVVKNSLVRIGLVVCYCLFVGIQNALISDIHDSTLATLPLMLLFMAIIKKKLLLYFFMMCIILGLKESFAGLMVGIGIYLVWLRQFKQGLITILFSLVWFYTVTHFVIPYFSHEAYFYASDANMSLVTLFQPFVKIKTLWYSFLSFGFLPLLYPPLLPAILENFFERFSTLADTRWGLGLHYSATLAPLFFMSSLKFLSFLEKKKIPKVFFSGVGITLIVITLILHRFILHGPLGLFYNPAFYQVTMQTKYLEDFIRHIPTTGLIMTQNDIALRLTHFHVTLLDTNFEVQKPETIALNLTPGQNPNIYFPASQDIAIQIKDRLLQSQNYTVKKYGDELYIFTHK